MQIPSPNRKLPWLLAALAAAGVALAGIRLVKARRRAVRREIDDKPAKHPV